MRERTGKDAIDKNEQFDKRGQLQYICTVSSFIADRLHSVEQSEDFGALPAVQAHQVLLAVGAADKAVEQAERRGAQSLCYSGVKMNDNPFIRFAREKGGLMDFVAVHHQQVAILKRVYFFFNKIVHVS
jgi:hypothetical protein